MNTAKFAIQLCGWATGFPLEILVISALLRTGYRKFPLIFVYAIVDFLTTVAEIPSNWAYYMGDRNAIATRADWYWIDETILQVLIYAVVMSLVYRATEKLRSRRIVRASLISGAILFALISLLVHFNPLVNRGTWMTPWTRDLNFCSSILDLALWAMLLASREKDYRLLMLSGGLGVQFTGETIGEAIRALGSRHRSRATVFTGNVIGMLADLTLLYVWWQAFRAPNNGTPKPERRQSTAA